MNAAGVLTGVVTRVHTEDMNTTTAAAAATVVRHFQRYTSEQRAAHAASHRMGIRQREQVGEFFYTHSAVPGLAFSTRAAAVRAASRAAAA